MEKIKRAGVNYAARYRFYFMRLNAALVSCVKLF